MENFPFITSANDVSDLLRLSPDGSTDWLWEMDVEWRYVTPSRKRAEFFGISQSGMVGKSIFDQMALNDVQRTETIFSQLSVNPRPFAGLVCRYLLQSEKILILETTGVPVYNASGQVAGYCCVDRDVTLTGLLTLDGRLAQLETVYATLPIALCVIGRDGTLLAVNNVHSVLAGRPISSLIGVRVAELSEQGGRNVERDFKVFDEGGIVPDHEFEVRGRIYLVSVTPLRNALGQVEAISVAHIDITERKRLEAELATANELLHNQASLDYVTGLFNRRRFEELLQEAIRSQQGISLIVVDIDFFKQFNDHYGHLAGDDCLLQVAQCITRTLHDTYAEVCRYGGDEFVIFLRGSESMKALEIAEEVRQAVEDMNLEHIVSSWRKVTLSLGVAILPAGQDISPGKARELLISKADQGLYLAKEKGRNRVCIIDALSPAD